MGISKAGKTPNATYYTDRSYIDGRDGESGYVYIGVNNCASFSFLGVKHEFIVMDDDDWPQFKIYEWTIHNLKMYACENIKFKKKRYLGRYKVSTVYNAALIASEGKKFSTVTYNCKDWVERVENMLNYLN